MDLIINAIESGNIHDIQAHMADLKEFSSDMLASLLRHSPSDEVTVFLKKVFRNRMTESGESVGDDSASCQGAGSRSAHPKERHAGSAGSASGDEETYENLSEDQAMEKHSRKNNKIDKAARMFLVAFKTNIKKINYDKSVFLCFEIANHISERKKDSFPKVVRSKSHNLKENAKLCEDIYSGRLAPPKFVEMSVSDMKSDELKNQDEVAIKDGLLASQVAKVAAETNMFRCSKCKERKCTYSQLQTRSCDEPMTTFVHCTVCGNRWRF